MVSDTPSFPSQHDSHIHFTFVDKRLTVEEVIKHPWLVEKAPNIPLQSPLFIKDYKKACIEISQ